MYCNMLQEKQIKYFTKAALSVCFIFLCQISQAGGDPFKKVSSGDTLKSPTLGAQLDKDEAIKCTRAELLSKEFVTVGNKSFPELLRITFQDLERGSREIIFQKKIVENDEVKFTMPMGLIKETAIAVLIVMKGESMFFKKIDIVEE